MLRPGVIIHRIYKVVMQSLKHLVTGGPSHPCDDSWLHDEPLLGIRHGANAGTVQQAAGSVWSGLGIFDTGCCQIYQIKYQVYPSFNSCNIGIDSDRLNRQNGHFFRLQ
jgi:hypothetical protein